ncbi:MAG: divalent metal cation transporter [Candidatus Hydrogenedentes bacterium]|nr:divalent metal cation transporter [Candidatus Hydrogenedentota bacterium]
MDRSESGIDDSASLGDAPKPWSLRPARLGARTVLLLGTGSVIASFYIGTGDVSVGTNMGAKFGYGLWWSYFVLGIAGWALIDMSVRYFLRFGKTPMSIFKDVHPAFTVYMFIAVVVCATFGSYNQWSACAMVVTGFFPGVPIEVGGALAALAGLVFLLTGAYKRLERVFVVGLVALIVCFFGSAFMAGFDWKAAAHGLIPQAPGKGWQALFSNNAGSMINAWLILIYPYTMIERGWFSKRLQGKVNVLHRARIDYAWGILAAGVVALPLMAAASAIARPFGIVPRGYMDLSILLEPLAGTWSTYLFLFGLFLAAWTAGVGWWLCGCYALLDIFNLPIRLDSKPMRVCLVLFFIPSTALLLLRVNPVFQMLIFTAFLTLVFPVIGFVLLYRISRPDMGYFRWSLKSPQGIAIVAADLFAICLSVYVGVWLGWVKFGQVFISR